MRAVPSRLDVAAQVGKRIREERERRGWSLDVLATLSSVGKSTLGQIEIGQNVPQLDTMIRIAAAFGLAVEEFLPADYLEAFSPKEFLQGLLVQLGSNRRSSGASNDSNTLRASRRSAKRVTQRKAKPGRTRREGGFPTAPLRRVVSRVEVA